MATAREAHMRRIARVMEVGRMRLSGKTFAQIAQHYNFGRSYAYMLFRQFERLTTPKGVGRGRRAGELSRYMKGEEFKELEHIKDWLNFLAKEKWE